MDCTVIFDMDGVLFDTENLIMQNWKEIAGEHGYDVEELSEVFYACIGTNAVVTKEIVCGHYGETFPSLTSLLYLYDGKQNLQEILLVFM